ncbi:amidohydrolase family protein [Longibacter salinarum]|nr:amidohydrolase family protein [Longibacter salinarum]
MLLPAIDSAAAQSKGVESRALVNGTLIQLGQAPLADAVIVIRGDEIAAVGSGDSVDIPEDAQVIDVSGRYVMPGMIDGHVHFFQSGGLYARPDVVDLRNVRPYEEEIAGIKERLPDTFRRYLASGVTSVVDVGGPMWNLDVRAQTDTMTAAPTVVTAGPLISSVEPDEFTVDDKPILRFESPEAAREEVRRQIDAGVDIVKIWYIVRGDGPEAFRPVVDAVIEEAHGRDTRVAVHATQLETAHAAVEAGADILVHSVYDQPVDDAFVRQLVEQDVIYVPTLMVSERYRETFAQTLDLTVAEHRIGQKDVIGSLFDLQVIADSLVPNRIQQMISSRPDIPSDSVAIRNLKAVHDAGVTIAAGTDAGNIGTLHGPSLSREFELMRAAGLTPAEVLATATVGGAALMGQDNLGRIEPGMQADLAIVRGNPLEDLQHAFEVDAVMRRGNLMKIRALVPPTAEAAVQQQLNAYNAHDLDGFMDAYADSVQIYTYPNRLDAEGKEAMREPYAGMFKDSPNLFANVTKRMQQGEFVVDYERVTGLGEDELTVIAMYHVNEDGKIDRVEFVR